MAFLALWPIASTMGIRLLMTCHTCLTHVIRRSVQRMTRGAFEFPMCFAQWEFSILVVRESGFIPSLFLVALFTLVTQRPLVFIIKGMAISTDY
ncbi:MAG: hypothetical protein C0630_16500 [Sedimenticola selenatireducens]|uniref:Uncharacterized protein n=1 Tax=Sedimenticola selenatireducens TaxID=191960 RepID=A0A2N6CTD5_9GAMM|nr:MAG: hypothetical protein C0630_16500 [Sedimenticola selenatireducens]